MRIDITWEVDDGYAGKSRPQHYTLNDFEVEEYLECETENEGREYLEGIIDEEFRNRINYYIQRVDIIE